ncbi:MAG: hypothetical protein KatS3mg131_3943 [Candidatus Tectimicrobiota bacterium]|nr:MAG: hypothetical protein KatS3mg131_3943 [Candidatus Tectomicrobia bacterium]
MDKVKVSLQEARADIQLKEGQRLEPQKLRQAVVGAGFTPTWIRFEGVGQLIVRNGGLAFKVQGTEQLIPLASDEKARALQQAVAQEGRRVFVVGLIPKGQETARVERFEVR